VYGDSIVVVVFCSWGLFFADDASGRPDKKKARNSKAEILRRRKEEVDQPGCKVLSEDYGLRRRAKEAYQNWRRGGEIWSDGRGTKIPIKRKIRMQAGKD